MSRYSIEVLFVQTYEWSDEKGEGDYLGTHSGFTLEKESYSLEEAKESLNDYFCYDIPPEDYGEDGFITVEMIDGNKLNIYTVCIDKIDRILSFNNEEPILQ